MKTRSQFFFRLGLIIAFIGTFITAFLLEALNVFFYSINIPKFSLKSEFLEMLQIKPKSRQSSREKLQEPIATVDAQVAAIQNCGKPPPELQKPEKTVAQQIAIFFDRFSQFYLGFSENFSHKICNNFEQVFLNFYLILMKLKLKQVIFAFSAFQIKS